MQKYRFLPDKTPKNKEIVKKTTEIYIFLTILFVCCNEKTNFVTIICL